MNATALGALKARNDLAELVGRSVELKRSGRSYKGLCPFHVEKTASFYVFPDSQSYKCFGCGAGGDIFTFLMVLDGVSFPEAVKVLGGDTSSQRPRRRAARRSIYYDENAEDFTLLAADRAAATAADVLQSLADSLGVSVGVLRRLGTFWSDLQGAYGFPMSTTPGGPVVGIRFRSSFGKNKKWSAKGGREGLFIPCDLDLSKTKRLFLTEGPTDTAAILALGLEAVGRPSCRGGGDACAVIARGRDVVVVSDRDEVGKQGAEHLASSLLLFASSVKIIKPPATFKDVRAWVRAGATRADILDLVRSAKALELVVAS